MIKYHAYKMIISACSENTFKQVAGDSVCQPCPSASTSGMAAAFCSCIEGYELIDTTCTGWQF